MHSKIPIWIAGEVKIKEDWALVVTVWRQRQEGDCDGDGADQSVVEFQNVERY